MRCSNCGEPIEEGRLFCLNCGQEVQWVPDYDSFGDYMVQEKLKKAIDAVGAEKGYTYILDPQIVLFSGNSAIDATQFVKAKLGIN